MGFRALALTGLVAMTALGPVAVAQTAAAGDDPFLWLEEIEGERALTWARAENDKTLGILQADPRYARFNAQAL